MSAENTGRAPSVPVSSPSDRTASCSASSAAPIPRASATLFSASITLDRANTVVSDHHRHRMPVVGNMSRQGDRQRRGAEPTTRKRQRRPPLFADDRYRSIALSPPHLH